MRTAAVRLRGEQRLYDLLEVFVEGEMTLLRVQLQASSRYSLCQMLGVMRRHEDVGFSVVEAHIDPPYLFEAERPRSYLAQFVVYPACRTLSHGFLKRLDEERSNVRPFEHPPIDFRKLLRKLCEAPLGILAYRPSCFTARRG